MNTLQRKAEAAANHKANLSASVKRRMEVARANNDAGLLNVLEQEMKQLGLNQTKKGRLASLFCQDAPPKTSMFSNKQTGEACPTRITWLGSPLPQKGEPQASTVWRSPTLTKLFQN